MSLSLGASDISVAQAGEDDLAAWQAFVDRMPAAGPLHHAGWYRVLREAYAVVPAFLIARDETGRIRGVLPTYRSDSAFTRRHVTSLEGGILAEAPDAVTALLLEALRLRDGCDARFLQLRGGPLGETPPVIVPTVHTVLETGKGVDALWAAMRKKTRWGVRQAERAQITVVEDAQLVCIERFYRLYAAHMRDLGTPVFGLSTVVAMRRHLGPERLVLYHVFYRDEPIGGMLCVRHGARWTDLYAIVRRTEPAKETEFANYLLYWHAIRDAASRNVLEFDLGRSTPGSSVHHFKRKWGGIDREELYAFFPRDSAGTGQMGLLGATREKGLRQRVWSLLPPGVCNVVGPIIRRDLPFL